MKAQHVEAFLASAFRALEEQATAGPTLGSPVLRSGPSHTARELTALVTLSGDLCGLAYCSMSVATATKLAAAISGDMTALLERITRDATATLGQQCRCEADTPTLIRGFGEPLTTVSPVLVVPLYTGYGDIDLGLALQGD